MCSHLVSVLLCVVVSIVLNCECAILKTGTTPKETSSTTLRLTAQRNDTGSWTTNFGDYQLTIEHKHYNTPEDQIDADTTWTMKVKHTSTLYQDEVDNTKNENQPSPENITTAINIIPIIEEIPLLEPRAIAEATTTAESYVVGIQVDIEPTLPSNDEIPPVEITSDDVPLTIEEERNVNSADNLTAEAERHNSEEIAEDFRSVIMDRYTRSRPTMPQFLDELGLSYKGYHYYSGIGFLKLNSSHLQWSDARKACEEEDAHLAIPDSNNKINVFKKVLQENIDIIQRAVLRNQVFVGVHDPFRNRKLTTVLGEFFNPDMSVWFPNEPNNADPGEDCITLHSEGKLRDVPCFYNLPFLCQIDVL